MLAVPALASQRRARLRLGSQLGGGSCRVPALQLRITSYGRRGRASCADGMFGALFACAVPPGTVMGQGVAFFGTMAFLIYCTCLSRNWVLHEAERQL